MRACVFFVVLRRLCTVDVFYVFLSSEYDLSFIFLHFSSIGSLLDGSWEASWEPLGRILGGSWEDLGKPLGRHLGIGRSRPTV